MWFDANEIGYNNNENHMRAFWGDNIVWVIVPRDNQVYYRTTNGQVYNPTIYGNPGGGFGANIVSNVYSNGMGVITFDGPVTRIGVGVFQHLSGNVVSDVFFPESVTEIWQYAFQYSNMDMAHITKNVSSISGYGYSDLNLDFVSVDPANTTYSVINDSIVETSTGTLVVGTNKSVIDSRITSIGPAAFSQRKGITSIDIPAGSTSIGAHTFYWCSYLVNVNIPSSIVSIGREAFSLCSRIPTITLPASLTSIGEFAFDYCSSMTEIIVNANTPPTAPFDSNQNCGVFGVPGDVQGRQIKVPASKVNLYKNTPGWSEYASEIVSQ